MSLTADLSIRHAALWEAMVTHPFVTEMGDGTLPVAKFRDYFIEDFVFVRDLVRGSKPVAGIFGSSVDKVNIEHSGRFGYNASMTMSLYY